jgi:hypothetical protein
MKIRKIVGICTAFVAAALMTVAAHAATYSTSTEVSGSDPNKVATLTVTATPSGSSETLNGFALKVYYDKSVLTPVQDGVDAASGEKYVTASSAIASGVVVGDKVDSSSNAYVAFAWADKNYITLSGATELATIKFNVASGATGTTDVKVEITQIAPTADKIASDSENSAADAETVVLTATFLLGDVNGDEKIDNKDALAVLQNDVKIVALLSDELKRGDVNKDGVVDAKDALAILQFDVGVLGSFDEL